MGFNTIESTDKIGFNTIEDTNKLYGEQKKIKGKELSELSYSYDKVNSPTPVYEPGGAFLNFKCYHVEVRGMLKCVTASEGWGSNLAAGRLRISGGTHVDFLGRLRITDGTQVDFLGRLRISDGTQVNFSGRLRITDGTQVDFSGRLRNSDGTQVNFPRRLRIFDGTHVDFPRRLRITDITQVDFHGRLRVVDRIRASCFEISELLMIFHP
ncbi:D-glucuronyl c5-epimerase [Plakobranchus ocellatus]|uniref:D-glucuronyl c5-epimerase n=1 Tax=Plakobranchus ocellatus TaxID=259542 RepID=A0AAV4DFK2_9GAST|nr:D-glucuronyl c5-epimerase [Plakobranchus ocellatus]